MENGAMGLVSAIGFGNERGGMRVPARIEGGRPFRIDVNAIVHNEILKFGEDGVKDLTAFEFAELFKRSVYPLPTKDKIAAVISDMPPIVLANSMDPTGQEIEIHSFIVRDDGMLQFKTNGDASTEVGKNIVRNAHVAVYMAMMMVLIRQDWDPRMDAYGYII
jgi:hypothetical protein